MRTLLRTAALMGAALLALAGTYTAQTTHQVIANGFSFTPNDLTIAEGDTVEWLWGSGSHNVESGDDLGNPDGIFSSGAPVDGAGTTFSVTFDNAFLTANPVAGGEYTYYCIVHVGTGMIGTVRVVGGVPAFPAWAAVSTGLLVLAGATCLLRGRCRPVGSAT